MKTRPVLFASLFALALLVSACGPTTLQQQAPPTQRSLSVTGTGTANLTPDMAYINIGVHTEKQTAAEAVDENNTQTQKVIQALTDAGIDQKDIRTTNFSIYPNDKYDPQTGQPTGQRTYVVDNTVMVTVRDLAKLGDLLDTVVQAGANTVSSIQFDVADKDKALAPARDAAVKDANAKAQELASSAGVQLGELISVSYQDAPVYPLYDARGAGGAAPQAASVPIQPGQLTFTVTVNEMYGIK
ncbi:MAG: SIMPL domain-containing protein [Bacteroidota bacterium]|jgi:uncharacterized protein YggE